MNMQEMAAMENAAARAAWGQGDRAARVRKVSKNDPTPTENKTAMRKIVRLVSAKSGVSADEIRGSRRDRKACRARQLCIWKAHKSKIATKQIGWFFNRDHTTVLHSVKVIENLLEAEK